MDNNKQSQNSMHYLQKKIIVLTRQYYKAIRDNTTFENLKTIFMKRKSLEKELSDVMKKDENNFATTNNINKEPSA